MADTYVVSVQRITRVVDPETGRETDRDYVTEVEFQGPAEALLRFAPAEVAAALGASSAAVNVNAETADLPRATPGDAFEQSEQPALVHTPDAQPSGEVKQTRKRRTRAEIEADKAAQAAGYRDAAHKAEADKAAQDAGYREPAHQAEVEAYKPAQGPTGNGDADLAGAEQATTVAADAPADAAPPWNPFLK